MLLLNEVSTLAQASTILSLPASTEDGFGMFLKRFVDLPKWQFANVEPA